MRDRPVILAGLALFVAMVTWPMWKNVAARAGTRGPEPKLPAAEKQCVAPRDYMRRAHMRLLIEWREAAVRRDIRTYHAPGGATYRMSLTGTCLKQCHTNKAGFCDRCHTYAAVKENCWQCHVDPQA
jgi:hypothetical protein